MTERELVLSPINPFSPREREIIELKANGLTSSEAAERLNISVRTVNNHISGYGTNLGILGKIEKITGRRPERGSLLTSLLEDVLVFSESEK